MATAPETQSENCWRRVEGGSTVMRGCLLRGQSGVWGVGCRFGKREGQEAGPTGKWKETLREVDDKVSG